MAHYEQRLERDLQRIRATLETVSEQVEAAHKNAVHALLTGNRDLAYDTVLGDHVINRAVRRLDRLCHSFIAVHLPSAGHLRHISTVIRTGIALERIGDYAVTVCREAVQLPKAPEGSLAREIELMAKDSGQMLHQALDAFLNGNAEAAKATMTMADQVERTFDAVFEALSEEEGWNTRDLFAFLVIFNCLERVSDQAKNICEEAVFAVTGETKAPKVYRVLFLDADNSCLAPMAAAIARKRFPASGEYESAGLKAAKELNPLVVQFLDDRGCKLAASKPAALEAVPEELASYQVLVSLQGPVQRYVKRVPFHTTALEWEIGDCPTPMAAEDVAKVLEEIYRNLAVRIEDLMTTLRGQEGD